MQTREHVLFGLPIAPMAMTDVLDRCQTALRTREPLLIGVVNAAKVVACARDAHLRASMLECDLIVADGQSVVWASRILGKRLPERVAGIDLFERLLEVAQEQSRRVYFLGATASVLEQMQARLAQRMRDLVVAGARDGYFDVAESSTVAREIRDAAPDMLFLGMTSPKKEIFLGTHGASLGVPILHGVGGSFDILAGVTKRAPALWQRLGAEWLYRVVQEPGRLWRRYLTTNAAFVWMTVRERARPAPDYRRAGA